jgi:hypothetical protein
MNNTKEGRRKTGAANLGAITKGASRDAEIAELYSINRRYEE